MGVIIRLRSREGETELNKSVLYRDRIEKSRDIIRLGAMSQTV